MIEIKTRNIAAAVTLAGALLVSPPVLHAAGNAPGMPVPQPGNTRLATLIGVWTGEADIQEAGQPPMKLKVKIDCRKASGGWGVRCDTNMASPSMNVLETDLFGYDATSGKVHWYAVTNFGEVHDHSGTWSGDSLSVRHSGKKGNDELTEDLTLNFDGGRMSFDCVTKVAGAVTETLKGTASRQ